MIIGAHSFVTLFYFHTPLKSSLTRSFIHLFNTKIKFHATKMLIERPRVCHNHKPQPTLDTQRKRKGQKHTRAKCKRSTKTSSLFPLRSQSGTESYLKPMPYTPPFNLCRRRSRAPTGSRLERKRSVAQ